MKRRPAHRQDRLRDSLHPPLNVRVVDSDGVEYPVQTVYAGTTDGIQHYEIVDAPDRQIVRILADILPARTSLGLPLEPT